MTDAPVHLRPRFLLLVAAGGAVGTAAREAVSLLVPAPFGVLAVNLVGAFVLGVLLEALLRRGLDLGRRRLLRLGLGTGFCGGFTTYSSLAVISAVLLADGSVGPALLSALSTVLLGGAATWAGVLAGARTAPA